MSVQAMSWAIKQQIATDAMSRHVLLILANYAGADGEDAFPSVARICLDTGISERTVRDRLSKLCQLGLIEEGNQMIAAAKGFRPDRTPTVYKMRFDRWKKEHFQAYSNGVQDAHPASNGVREMHERGARDVGTGCEPRTLTVKKPPINRHTPNNPPKGEESEELSKAFDLFWSAYPAYRRTGGKDRTRRSFMAAAKKDSVVAILTGLKDQMASWPSEASDPNCRFVPQIVTWINQRRYHDEASAHGTNFRRGNKSSDILANLYDEIQERLS